MHNDDDHGSSDKIIRHIEYIPRKPDRSGKPALNAIQRRYKWIMYQHRKLREKLRRVKPTIDCMDWIRRGHGWDTKDDSQQPSEPSQAVLASYKDFMQRNNIECKFIEKPLDYSPATDAGMNTDSIRIATKDQSDTGANTNATPHLDKLRNVKWIERSSISSAEQGATMDICAVGTFDLICHNAAIPINMYYWITRQELSGSSHGRETTRVQRRMVKKPDGIYTAITDSGTTALIHETTNIITEPGTMALFEDQTARHRTLVLATNQ